MVPDAGDGAGEAGITDVERELRELEDEEVRMTNAYKGAENTVGSIHQRKGYLSLDREASRFVKGKGGWVLRERGGGDNGRGRLGYPFYVGGPEVERSVVTRRLGDEVLRDEVLKDEGVVGFVKRKGWRPVLN